MPKAPRVTRELGEKLAISALAFLAEDLERLGAFLSQSGIGPEMIRKAAADPAFLAGVLDHVVADERLLRAVAEYAGVSPETVEQAHLVLSGNREHEIP
jgi:hypothetical protein